MSAENMDEGLEDSEEEEQDDLDRSGKRQRDYDEEEDDEDDDDDDYEREDDEEVGEGDDGIEAAQPAASEISKKSKGNEIPASKPPKKKRFVRSLLSSSCHLIILFQ